MTALALALVIPWSAGIVLALLDGGRRLVGWLAVAVLAANLAALVVLAVQVLPDGTVSEITGDGPEGVGITLRADPLGVLFAVLSSLALLAATIHEVLDRVRERVFPGVVVLLAAGLSGVFLTGGVFDFYVFFELSMTAAYILAAYGGTRRELGAALVFTAVNLLGTFVFPALGSGPLPRDRHAGHGADRGARRRRQPQRGDPHRRRVLRGVQCQARPVPLPLLAAHRVHRRATGGRRDPERRPGEHRRLRAAAFRRRAAARRARAGRHCADRDRVRVDRLRRGARGLAPHLERDAGLLRDRAGRVRDGGDRRRRSGRLRGGDPPRWSMP